MATSIFAWIGTIKGKSRDAKHRDEIEVLSRSWGVSHGGTGSDRGQGGYHRRPHRLDQSLEAILRC